MMMAALSSFWRDERGAAGAEMALMTPLLLLLMFAPMELGHFYWSQHKISKGVRDASRYAARQPFSVYEGFGCNAEITGDIAGRIKNLALSGTIDPGRAKIPGWELDDVKVFKICRDEALDGSGDNFVNTGIYSGVDNAPIVRVEADVTYPSLFESLGFDATDIEMTAHSESAVMGL